MDNNIVYVTFYNNNFLGVFDNEQTLKYTLDGCIQNGFIKKEAIKVERYLMNSFYKFSNLLNDNKVIDVSNNNIIDGSNNNIIDISNNNIINVSNNNIIDDSNNNIIDVSNNIIILSKEELEDKEREKILVELEKNRLRKQIEKKQKELEKSDEYIKMAQDKIDIKQQINELKMKKRKLEEEKQSFTYDLELYKNLQKEILKKPNFKIPELFEKKFKLLFQLEQSNKLNFEDFKLEWDIIKPKNNYNLFSITTYEDSFNKNKEESKSIEIELDI